MGLKETIEGMRSDLTKAYKDTDAAYKSMDSMEKAAKPTKAPSEPDDASAGRKFKKDEPGMPEQPGSLIRVKKMAKGGSASARADGIASKGKTKGTIVTMCGGGKAKK